MEIFFLSLAGPSMCQFDNDLLILVKIVLFKLMTMSTSHVPVSSAYILRQRLREREILEQSNAGLEGKGQKSVG